MHDNIIRKIEKAGLNVHGIEVFRSGDIVLRHFFHEDRRYPIYSATKSLTSAAVSIAADEGKLSPDCLLYKLLERRYHSMMTEDFKRLTIGRFMSMTAGKYPFRPQGEDWTEYILSLPVDNADASYNYSNIPAYLVGAACENAVGMSLIDYLMPRLFEPLGIPRPVYQISPEGHFYGATGMELTVHELSLFGQLCLQGGEFGGVKLISRERVMDSVTAKVKTESGGYGYFFGVNAHGFSINGKWGQRCLVYPEKELMITYLSDLPERADEMLALANEYAEEIL